MSEFTQLYPIRASNGLDPDQDRSSVGPDLGPNCLQRLSADDKSRLSKERVNQKSMHLILYPFSFSVSEPNYSGKACTNKIVPYQTDPYELIGLS